jgi:penicillin-binding protein 2
MSSYFIKKKREEIAFEEILLDNNKEGGRIDHFFDIKKIKNLQRIFLLVMLFLMGRLFYLQVVKGDLYSSISEQNYIRMVDVKSSRGIIYDRNMSQIVFNVPVFDLVLTPADFFKDRNNVQVNIGTMAEILGISGEDFRLKISEATKDPTSYQSILIMENIEKEKALVIDEKIKNIGGVKLENSAIRKYVDGKYFSDIIGYSGRINREESDSNPNYLLTDTIGKEGLELSYEQELRGVYGKQEVEVDSLGKVNRFVQSQAPASGRDLVLSIDAELQKRLYDEIAKMNEKYPSSTGGSAVAIDPRDGSVLALVSYPSYDNNIFAKGITSSEYGMLLNDENRPLFNRAIAGEYPPGSTFKPLMAAAVLQEGSISPTRKIFDSGAINVSGWIFPDWKAHGEVDLVKAIAQSCNVYFYTVGGGYGDIKGIGEAKIKQYANLFGLGEKTGIDIPGEKAGLIPDEAWKKGIKNEPWYIGDTYHMSIGQGDVLATPLQIANYTVAVANGGTLYKPRLVYKILDAEGNVVKETEAEIIRKDFIDAENIAWVQKGMRENIVSGSGMSISALDVESAGKTGTAQYAGNQKSHAWYTVYAPYESPEIVMAIMVEGGGEGHLASVPIAKNILHWYFGERLTGVSEVQKGANE